MWAETHADAFLSPAPCRARAGQRGRESMWAARTHLFLSPGTGAMPDTRSENESMLIEGELVAKGAGVEGDVPTWCGTPRMSAAGRVYFYQAGFYLACWRAHVLVTLSFGSLAFVWARCLAFVWAMAIDGGRHLNVPNKARCREVRRYCPRGTPTNVGGWAIYSFFSPASLFGKALLAGERTF